MKEICIKAPTVIAGAVRYPVENPIPVTDDEAERQRENGNLIEDDAEVEEDLEGMKVDDLKALAAAEEIDLGKATSKADIIAAIRAGRDASGE